MGLLEIYCTLQQSKNFANRSRTDKAIATVTAAPLFDSQCSSTSVLIALLYSGRSTSTIDARSIAVRMNK